MMASWHSHATRTIYSYFLQMWVRPHWGENSLRTVPTIAVSAGYDDYAAMMAARWLTQPKRKSAISWAARKPRL